MIHVYHTADGTTITWETTDVPAEPPALTAEDRLAAAKAALDSLDSLDAPILTGDVVDVLAALREVL